jgi:hypothetical protein
MSSERTIQVKADDINLKLTLSAKLQKKSFADAVLAPFTKAYNKKKGTEWTVDDLVSVTVDDELMTDYSLTASIVLLSGETVEAKLMYRVPTRREMLLETDPFAKQTWEPPKPAEGGSNAGTVDFIADEDDRSEIEKLKAERRAKRLEKEREAPPPPPPDVSDGGAAAAAATSAAPPAAAAASEKTPEETAASLAAASLSKLQSTEATVEMLQAQLEHLTVKAEAIEGKPQPGVRKEDVQKVAKKELQDMLKEVNALLVGLDEVSLFSIATEEERLDARARKKHCVMLLEERILPSAKALQRRVEGTPSGAAVAAPAAPPKAAPPPTTGQSAEIDSDVSDDE